MTRCTVREDCVLSGMHRRQGSGDLSGMLRHRRQGSGDFSGFRLLRTASGGLGVCTSPGMKACASARRATPKLEFGCRMALSENQLQADPARPKHSRQNSLSQALEGLDLEEAFPSENQCSPDETLAARQEQEIDSISFSDVSMSSESKTARRRAEYNSKSKDVTFNQKKHMTPSYQRRLQRRRIKEESKRTCRPGRSG